MSKYKVFHSEYKGSPVLEIHNIETQRKIAGFGLVKAKAILASIDDIQAFVDSDGKIGADNVPTPTENTYEKK